MKEYTLEHADYYQGLFNLISNEHGLILTISELDEIIKESLKVIEKINNRHGKENIK